MNKEESKSMFVSRALSMSMGNDKEIAKEASELFEMKWGETHGKSE